jgi:2-dehydropantoate 2-reductase
LISFTPIASGFESQKKANSMTSARYIIYGAGGVGASIGAQLHQIGLDVVLIARGAHLQALLNRGLDYRTPAGALQLQIPCVSHPSELNFESRDRIVLATKTQDTLEALSQLQQHGQENIPILCAQNGVHNERLALRRFSNVYGLAVWIPASFSVPGVVSNFAPGAPIELGRIPKGDDDKAHSMVADLTHAGFAASFRTDVLAWKHAKLIMNIQTTIDAICGSRDGLDDVCKQVQDEAHRCLAAADIDIAPHDQHTERLKQAAMAIGKIEGQGRSGGSSSQSLERGIGSIETDYINGEIVLLGRLHGVPTPANAVIQATANALASQGTQGKILSADELRSLIAEAST